MGQTARFACALTLALIAWACSPLAARAAAYDESTSGDLSGVAAAPMSWALDLGANILTGTAGKDANVIDFDLVAFTVPAGLRLDSVLLTNYQNASPFGASFFALQAGTPWLDGFGFDIGGNFLMGWAHADSTMKDFDLLYLIQDHANEPPFAIPLASGAYTMLIQDTDTTFDYTLTFYASPVPEPASAALFALGGVGILRRGGKRRK